MEQNLALREDEAKRVLRDERSYQMVLQAVWARRSQPPDRFRSDLLAKASVAESLPGSANDTSVPYWLLAARRLTETCWEQPREVDQQCELPSAECIAATLVELRDMHPAAFKLELVQRAHAYVHARLRQDWDAGKDPQGPPSLRNIGADLLEIVLAKVLRVEGEPTVVKLYELKKQLATLCMVSRLFEACAHAFAPVAIMPLLDSDPDDELRDRNARRPTSDDIRLRRTQTLRGAERAALSRCLAHLRCQLRATVQRTAYERAGVPQLEELQHHAVAHALRSACHLETLQLEFKRDETCERARAGERLWRWADSVEPWMVRPPLAIPPAIAAALPCCRSLRVLEVRACECKWRPESVRALVDAVASLPALERLELARLHLDALGGDDAVHALAGELFAAIDAAPTLRSVQLQDVRMPFGYMRAVGLSKLTRLEINIYNAWDALYEGEGDVNLLESQLRAYTLTSQSMSERCGAQLVEALPQLRQLSELTLHFERLGSAFAEALAGALAAAPALTRLALRDWAEGDTRGFQPVLAALPACPRLASLDLADFSLKDPGTSALVDALPRCAQLTWLALSVAGGRWAPESDHVVLCTRIIAATRACPKLEALQLTRVRVTVSSQLAGLCDRLFKGYGRRAERYVDARRYRTVGGAAPFADVTFELGPLEEMERPSNVAAMPPESPAFDLSPVKRRRAFCGLLCGRR